jgi:hypothetical protein
MSSYHSFLICEHPKEGFINVYIDGLILGQISHATKIFTPDPLMERRNPFGSLEALRDHVCSIMNLVAPLAVTGTVEATPGGTAIGTPVRSPICVMCGGVVQDNNGTLICPECAPRLAAAMDKSLPGEKVQIVLNGVAMDIFPKTGEVELTYEDIVRMAVNQDRMVRGQTVLKPGDELPHLSVVYHHRVSFEQLPGERDGSMHKGCKPVKATPGMVINAVHTGNA